MHPTIDIGKKSVVIIGWPASGKTYVSNQLWKDNPDHNMFHTDDYMHHGFVDALYALLKDIKKSKKPVIVEGMQGYRLLRKGVELDCFYPDIVIELEITEKRMLQTYAEQRPGRDTRALKGFIHAQQKILNDYKRMYNTHKPQWHLLKNNY